MEKKKVETCLGNHLLAASIRDCFKRIGIQSRIGYFVNPECVNMEHKSEDFWGLDYALKILEEDANSIIILCSQREKDFFENQAPKSVCDKFEKIMAHKYCGYININLIASCKDIVRLYNELVQKQ
jgi:hypothetical protein